MAFAVEGAKSFGDASRGVDLARGRLVMAYKFVGARTALAWIWTGKCCPRPHGRSAGERETVMETKVERQEGVS